MAETTRYLSEKINGQRRMSAFDPKRQLPNPALRPRARIATFLDFSWPFAPRTAPTSAKLSLAHGDFYFACA
jgi:hypothetical protein